MNKRSGGLNTKLIVFFLAAAIFFSNPGIAMAAEPAESVDRIKLVPVGHTVGVKMFSDGVLIIGLSAITTDKGEFSPATEAGLKSGDMITHIGTEKVTGSRSLTELLQKTQGKESAIKYTRKGRPMQCTIRTVKCSDDGVYKIGAWVRDSMAGIGTMTYYDPNTGIFGALGHGVTDIDTNELMPLSEGAIMHSTVKDVKKSVTGSPGELRGEFDLSQDMGSLHINSGRGIFGFLSNGGNVASGEAIPMGYRSDVKIGKATIYSNVSGNDVGEYEIEIIRLYPKNESSTRNMMIEITDKKLIEMTGGIVQGMSGSPIIQNGKIIGAVTHVLVNDTLKGYGILIENMLEEASALTTRRAA